MNDLSAKSGRPRFLVLLLLLLNILATRAAADPVFTVTDLGPGGAVGINSSGQVLIENGGSASIANTTGPNAGTVTPLPSEGQGQPGISAVAINDNGQVIARGNALGPLLFSPGGGGAGSWTALGVSGGANALNGSGQVVGSAGIDFPQADLDNGKIIQLGTLGGTSSAAYGINANGQVVGSADTASGALHAFLWSNGKMTDLGTLGGQNSSALSINDSGQIVGLSYTANGSEHAFLYTNQTMKDLGTLPGDSSSLASQINAMGEIIGMSFTYPNTPHYFLYSNGVMQDINSLLPVGSGWTISNITGLNDLGQIVGQGYDSADGSEHAILLSPEVPEPSSIALPMILAGLAVVRRYYRRVRSAPLGSR